MVWLEEVILDSYEHMDWRVATGAMLSLRYNVDKKRGAGKAQTGAFSNRFSRTLRNGQKEDARSPMTISFALVAAPLLSLCRC